MKFLWRTAVVSVAVRVLLAGAVSSVRWARRGGTAAGLAANALLLAFGMALVAAPPKRGAEQVQEQEDKSPDESGEPPAGLG